MPLSPLASYIAAGLPQSCTVEPWDATGGLGAGYDENAQPVYGTPRAAACRIAPRQVLKQATEGDEHGAWGTVLMFAADDPISDKDRITIPGLEDRGPIIAMVTPFYDLEGQLTHKEVAI